MLYVINVRTGSENKTISDIRQSVSPDLFTTVYTPLMEECYKVEKKWVKRYKVLFPGYIFVDTDTVEDFRNQLRLITGYTRMLGEQKEPVSVTDEEMELINKLVNNNYVMEVSEGVIIGSRVKIQHGPLIGLEGLIVGINRHKRKAWIETDMFGRHQVIEVGVEITSKM